MLAFAVQLEHFLGVQTAQHSVSFSVSVGRDAFDSPIAKAKVFRQCHVHCLSRNINVRSFLDLLLDLSSRKATVVLFEGVRKTRN